MSKPPQPIFEENNQTICRLLLDEGLSPDVELQRPKHQLFSVVTRCLMLQQKRNMADIKNMFAKLTNHQEESTSSNLSSLNLFTDNIVVTAKHEDK